MLCAAAMPSHAARHCRYNCEREFHHLSEPKHRKPLSLIVSTSRRQDRSLSGFVAQSDSHTGQTMRESATPEAHFKRI